MRFDPTTETFTEFKSLTYKTPNGTGTTYGAAGDRDGNGWWAEMTIDTIGHADAQDRPDLGAQAAARRDGQGSRHRRAA